MWEAISALAAVFAAWVAWEEHKRKKEEEYEARYRSREQESRNYTSQEIGSSQPTQKNKSPLFTEVDDCLCGLAYWFLWFLLCCVIISTIDTALAISASLQPILLILVFIPGIVLGRYLQKKIHPLLR
ncbi:hypothetical protein [Phormidium nigroviride]